MIKSKLIDWKNLIIISNKSKKNVKICAMKRHANETEERILEDLKWEIVHLIDLKKNHIEELINEQADL